MKSDDGKIDPVVAREAHAALRLPCFLEFCEMARSLGNVLERTAHRLEGCECHRAIWVATASHKTKKRLLQKQTGFDHCHKKTR